MEIAVMRNGQKVHMVPEEQLEAVIAEIEKEAEEAKARAEEKKDS